MILIIGGRFSGKKEYAKENFSVCDNDFSQNLESEKPVIWGIENFNGEISDELLEKLANKKILIASETGCGVVPMLKEEREQRERTGQLLQALAKRAKKVVRVFCGIGTVIKE
ncbi:MAG: bifunctional adenosylcobinamide kinase/adenosylcobinamide-phosphate guanylyltransferase [Oscillospiraceae bacterium]